MRVPERGRFRRAPGPRRHRPSPVHSDHPTPGAAAFSTGAFAQTVRDDKGSFRVDGNSRFGLLSAYYFVDDYRLDNPYPDPAGRRERPGFDALTRRPRAVVRRSAATRCSSPALVNEFHFSYMRNANDIGTPNGGLGVAIASQGFVTGPGTPGIVVQAPQFEGVENIKFNKFTIGVTTTGVNQVNNTLHWNDNVSRVIGTHTVRVGGEFEYAQVDLDPNASSMARSRSVARRPGRTSRTSCSASQRLHSGGRHAVLHLRNNYAGAFAQDSWRVRSNLTLNYGLRWDLMAPWYEQIQPDSDVRTGPAFCCLSRRADRTGVPGDGIPRHCRLRAISFRRASALRICPRSADRPRSRRFRRTDRAAFARASACSTRQFPGCRPASCTAFRRTAITT